VLEAVREQSRPAPREQESKTAEVAIWLREFLSANGAMPTERVIQRAKADGMYPSRNTFDRARKLADVESVRPGDVRSMLGDAAYESLTETERRAWWMRVPDVGDPPLEDWSDVGE
jgi:hypothetical protein